MLGKAVMRLELTIFAGVALAACGGTKAPRTAPKDAAPAAPDLGPARDLSSDQHRMVADAVVDAANTVLDVLLPGQDVRADDLAARKSDVSPESSRAATKVTSMA